MPPAETLTDTTALAKPTRPPPTAEDVMRLANAAIRVANLGRMQSADREDIFAELCLFGVRQLASYQSDRAAFSTHFFRWAILKAQECRKGQNDWLEPGKPREKLFDMRYAPEGDSFLAVDDGSVERIDTADEANSVELVLLRTLTEREHAVFIARVVDGMTLAEISIRLGVTKERVRQIEIKATDKAKRAMGASRE